MIKVATKVMAVSALMALISAPAVNAAEATAGLDVKSAYVFRGTTFNEGFVAQPYIDVAGLPININVWGNFDLEADDQRGYDNGEFSEVDITLSYDLPIDALDVSVGYIEYLYPGLGGEPTASLDTNGTPTAEGTSGEADREVFLSLGLKDCPLKSNLTVYYSVDGAYEEDLYAQVSIGHDLSLTEELTLGLGALVGYSKPDDGEDGFNQYELSATLSYGIFTLGVAYIGQIDDDVLIDATADEAGYDVEVVGTIGVSYVF